MPSDDGSHQRPLSIALAAPVRPGSTSGNSVTARRWQQQLIDLGHAVSLIEVDDDNQRPLADFAPGADLVIALHARRCASAAQAAKRSAPDRPLIVALAGTDLYGDLPDSADARTSVELADRLLVLQDDALAHLHAMNPDWPLKAHVVHQSVAPSDLAHNPSPETFTIVVLSHLRDVKDPLLTAEAVRNLPESSTVQVRHAGAAHTSAWEQRALDEQRSNPRYRWLGPLDKTDAAQLLATASVLACTSLLEGGANVVSESIALGVPVIGTDIGGNRGLLGADHPGLVPVRDAPALGALIVDLERDPNRLATLTQHSIARQWMIQPAHERQQWQALLTDL